MWVRIGRRTIKKCLGQPQKGRFLNIRAGCIHTCILLVVCMLSFGMLFEIAKPMFLFLGCATIPTQDWFSAWANFDLVFNKNVHLMKCVSTHQNLDLRPDLDRSRLGDFVGGHQEAQFLRKRAEHEENHSSTSIFLFSKNKNLHQKTMFKTMQMFIKKQSFIKATKLSSKTAFKTKQMFINKNMFCGVEKSRSKMEPLWHNCRFVFWLKV